MNTLTQAVTPISTHRFNGLHWRIAKAWHAQPDAQNKPDRKTTFWYDAAWRVIQENQVDQVNESGTLQEAVIQQFWGVRYIDDAVARLRLTGDGTGKLQAGSTEDLAFQLTDAQFSVIAVATPGKPSVVIDRIAYTPYGESTRTLRSDVNGDGVVNKDDFDGVIQPVIGKTIGSSAYLVEADLDRDGKISSDDYDLCIADDGQKSSGGVGEAGLFSAGVRNSVGYCGYIHNEDTGLYTVRYRTYSATLGRWLTRDPLGYVGTLNLYESVDSDPIWFTDPFGLSPNDSPQWHHLFPDAVFKNCKEFDYEKAEYGLLFQPGDHKWDEIHSKWNKEWKTWLKELEDAKTPLTEDLARKKLDELMKDPRFTDWLSKGAPAKVCKKAWNALEAAEKKLAADAAHAAAAASRKVLTERLATKILKKTGKAAGKFTVVLPLAFFVSDYLFTEKSLAVCIIDNGNPIPIEVEDVQAAIAAGQKAYSDYVDEGRRNIEQQRIRNTMGKNLTVGERPLPGECGCGN